MKLKKQVKVVIVVVLLCGFVGGFYSFNRWFFAKYKIKENDVAENKESKEIKKNEENLEEEPLIKQDTSSDTSKSNKKKIRPTKEYYCSENDTLEGDECLTIIETDAMEVKAEDNRDYYELDFNLGTMASLYGVGEQEMTEILKKVCEQEINGTFKIENANTKEGSCIFTDMPEDNSFHYMCLDSSYTLKGNKCTRQEKIPAKVRFSCPKGYVLDGIYCQEK